jgi:hypothetical protein
MSRLSADPFPPTEPGSIEVPSRRTVAFITGGPRRRWTRPYSAQRVSQSPGRSPP